MKTKKAASAWQLLYRHTLALRALWSSKHHQTSRLRKSNGQAAKNRNQSSFPDLISPHKVPTIKPTMSVKYNTNTFDATRPKAKKTSVSNRTKTKTSIIKLCENTEWVVMFGQNPDSTGPLLLRLCDLVWAAGSAMSTKKTKPSKHPTNHTENILRRTRSLCLKQGGIPFVLVNLSVRV